MTRAEEVQLKLGRLRSFMAERRLDAVLLRTQANFAWITAGGDNHVGIASDAGVADVLVTPDAALILTTNIEACRIETEEVESLGFDVRSFNWWEDMAAEIEPMLVGRRTAADLSFGDAHVMPDDIARLRWQLTEPEIERYRYAGEVVGEVLGDVCRAVRPGETEAAIAGRLANGLLAGDLIPGVVLVATDGRVFSWRHPIPKADEALERYAMLVVCGRYQGLWACATRLVHFGPLSEELKQRQEVVARVDATFIACTRAGAPVQDIWNKALQAYADGGYPSEWQLHHQGGATGYAPREYKATPTLQETVLEHQAFAWNPSVQGTKSEDTIIATTGRPEVLTQTAQWPMVDVVVDGEVWPRPGILVR
jgi:Xaa-Pro aminopeptidase